MSYFAELRGEPVDKLWEELVYKYESQGEELIDKMKELEENSETDEEFMASPLMEEYEEFMEEIRGAFEDYDLSDFEPYQTLRFWS